MVLDLEMTFTVEKPTGRSGVSLQGNCSTEFAFYEKTLTSCSQVNLNDQITTSEHGGLTDSHHLRVLLQYYCAGSAVDTMRNEAFQSDWQQIAPAKSAYGNIHRWFSLSHTWNLFFSALRYFALAVILDINFFFLMYSAKKDA
ncbi:hypothetical protein CEXT_689201 [Caerostris extrusa]|uniref:Uncharacterized protein n=1 Tax=Caerostris extrusa TaxID=172846 RepID=A0AAV4Q7G9_CAEEX|nr:hypothetical protein CEXT_689201 [Caerostris extrusa]